MDIPKYKKIYDRIVKLILTDEWPVGSNMKSENELIKMFRVSRITIRNVLNILENEERILRSRGKATSTFSLLAAIYNNKSVFLLKLDLLFKINFLIFSEFGLPPGSLILI